MEGTTLPASTQTIWKGTKALFGVAIVRGGLPSLVTLATVQGVVPVIRGTAFAVAEDKFLTCSHVLPTDLTPSDAILLLGLSHSNQPKALVRVSELAVRDEGLDFALLKGTLTQGFMEPLEIDFRNPVTGEDVIAVGFPLPEERQVGVANREVKLVLRATKGIVAAWHPDQSTFEMDAQFLPGLSGAPVLAAESGKVIGMAQGFVSFRGPAGVMSAVLGLSLSLGALGPRRAELGL